MTESTQKWPGQVDECHPEIFTKVPANVETGTKPGQLTKEQITQFFTEVSIIF